MDNDYHYDNPWAGQQPDDTEHVINYLNSDHGIMFPTNEFTESPEDYSAGIHNPALPPAEVDGFALPPAIDEHDLDAGELHLNDLYPQAHTPLAEAC
ncbi:uncharacterized protein FMAN_15288 [Fusarium mangiferae]|uniref:Uncharacterized protein n=1 Tax=Fusarium mangiferae TaxID=192010 RepID=A0A1L7U8W3_FUSMA|nr:uncharacterized protein FMAN_15288 [Fusarium mangiferae]CVL07144.1 uncharacterized protein FMAN_15288 [Fusarium mangiferae]